MDKNLFQDPQAQLQGKGLGRFESSRSAADVAAAGWSILAEDVSLPVAVLALPALQHNLAWMREFAAAYGCLLAPHGKTTMSPALFQAQREAGAWGITLATAPQVEAAFEHGQRRILMANQLVGRRNLDLIADLQARDEDFWFACLVDSASNVDALGRQFAARGQRVRVLLEVGVSGGRTGVRDVAQADAVLEAIARWPQSVALVGVETYEGVLKDEDGIRQLLRQTVAQWRAIAADGGFAETPALLSGAGSAWFDVVAEEFAACAREDGACVVLRPGCYLTHDIGAYQAASVRMQAGNPVAHRMATQLRPALKLWAYVQSRPEPERVIVGLGKRDAAFDAGFPQPDLHHRPGDAAPAAAAVHWQVTAMMDQHAFLQVRAEDDLQVGDLISFDIAHPCLTFDKWRHLLLVDAHQHVIGAVTTHF
ncbi:amino acid deaminase [Pseudoxanthomonas indica]|uniref:D-serine dehydratase n=1 Tax=Pseudoxanthomonas indica TaxID=428993 RepID=A0A1T5KWJ9_9GAMM|nr:amino acid deaminase [Pseudoxanthomonas indica]SKC68051.1 D-serine dehydratase [Pseudoxanthomonas indica]